MRNIIKVAVLITCHNRCELTERCLSSLKKAQMSYNNAKQFVECYYFLTDDKCTDGTADCAKLLVGDKLTIVNANGDAFWAGGMRMAWQKAMASYDFDFYLLINDDTEVWDNLFLELFTCHEYAMAHFGDGGLYCGNTSWFNDKSKISFGGKVLSNRFLGRFNRLLPNGKPQCCDVVNANILMICSSVVKQIGIFPSCYVHGAADYDYGMRANHAGIPVLITPGFCGSCDADNYNYFDEMERLSSMTIKERIQYFEFPVRSIHDSLAFSIRWRKCMVPIILFMHYIQILSPSIYYKLFRNHHRVTSTAN